MSKQAACRTPVSRACCLHVTSGLSRRRCGRWTLGFLRLLALWLACGCSRRCDVGTTGDRRDGGALTRLVEERVELGRLERLLRDELLHDEVELVAVLRQYLVRTLARALDDVVDFGVDDLRDLFRVVALFLDLTTEEDELVASAVLERAELLAHPELRDHLPRHLGRLLDV